MAVSLEEKNAEAKIKQTNIIHSTYVGMTSEIGALILIVLNPFAAKIGDC